MTGARQQRWDRERNVDSKQQPLRNFGKHAAHYASDGWKHWSSTESYWSEAPDWSQALFCDSHWYSTWIWVVSSRDCQWDDRALCPSSFYSHQWDLSMDPMDWDRWHPHFLFFVGKSAVNEKCFRSSTMFFLLVEHGKRQCALLSSSTHLDCSHWHTSAAYFAVGYWWIRWFPVCLSNLH